MQLVMTSKMRNAFIRVFRNPDGTAHIERDSMKGHPKPGVWDSERTPEEWIKLNRLKEANLCNSSRS